MQPGEILVAWLVTGLLQILLSNYMPIALLIDIPLIVTLYIGWYSQPVAGAFVGTFMGLTQDVTQILPFWGLNGFSKTLVGFAAGYLSRWVVMEGIVARGLMIAGVSMLDSVIVRSLLNLQPQLANRSWGSIALQAVLTALVGALFFQVYDRHRFPAKDFRQLG